MQPTRPRPPALDPPMVPIVITGTVIWAVLGAIMLPFRDRLDANGHGTWLPTCLAGVALGLLGLAMMLPRDAKRKRRRESKS